MRERVGRAAIDGHGRGMGRKITAAEGHAAAVDVVGQVIDHLQAEAHGVAVHSFDEFKVDVINRFAIFETVNQVQRRDANALEELQHDPRLLRGGLGQHVLPDRLTVGIEDDEPMCMVTTVSVSWQASQSTSHSPL